MSIFTSNKNPLFLIAEIGGNHEGDFQYAEKLTRLAIVSGVDAVKFQIYSGDTLVSRVESPERNLHFKKFELSTEQYSALAQMCLEADVMFMASVWDIERLDLFDPYISIHKVGSGDITAFPLIKKMVETGKPIILSTGLCTLDEIQHTIDYIQVLDSTYVDDSKLALLQCTTSYPCPDEDVHLNAMLLLQDTFGLPVGFSDHTIGNDAALAAATMGAEILEMHFTDEREGKTFRDHFVSISKEETRTLLEKIRKIKTLQGAFDKNPTASELQAKHIRSFRRSVYASRNILSGEVFSQKNLTVLRPEHGVSANRFEEFMGKKAKRPIAAHEVLLQKDLTPEESD